MTSSLPPKRITDLPPATTPLTGNETLPVIQAGVAKAAQVSSLATFSTVPWTNVTGTPTTLSGYGITDAVPTSRQVSTGTGLSGGGTLAADLTLTLANTAVSA